MLKTLEGHMDEIYSICFNLPYDDKVATCSRDKTAKLWDATTGFCLATFNGHDADVIGLAIDPDSTTMATISLDNTAILWDIETQIELIRIKSHKDQINTISFNSDGDKILTGSNDFTAKIFDSYNGEEICSLNEHKGIISSCEFNYDGNMVLTSSFDKTCKLWDLRNNSKSLKTFNEHSNKIMDACFNLAGTKIASCSADTRVKVYDVKSLNTEFTFVGDGKEVSKVIFDSRGYNLITGSDNCRLYNLETGECKQILDGFPLAFDYDRSTIITSKFEYGNVCLHIESKHSQI